MRTAAVLFDKQKIGTLTENEEGYFFVYSAEYAASPNAFSISKTLPLQTAPFKSKILFSFFDGLIPEGWLLDIAEKNWKLKPSDRMGLLLACCKSCIGAISVEPITETE